MLAWRYRSVTTDPRVGDILPAFLQQQALETGAGYCRAGEFLSANTKVI